MLKSRNGPIKTEVLENSLKTLVEEKSIKSIHHDETSKIHKSILAIPKFYYAEQRIVENFQRLAKSESFTKFDAERDLIFSQENRLGIKLDSAQLDAIEAALERDNFMSAEDAKKFGIIDEIQTKRAKQIDTKPQ